MDVIEKKWTETGKAAIHFYITPNAIKILLFRQQTRPEVPGLASNEDIQVSIPTCRSMVETKHYAQADHPHLSIELVIPGTTVQSYVSAGAEYLQNGDTTCQGVTRVIRGRMIK